jgi:hypothetical protein
MRGRGEDMNLEERIERNSERRDTPTDARPTFSKGATLPFDPDATWSTPIEDPDATWPMAERAKN